MAKKPKNKINPMITTLAEFAVDDALAAAEKWPGKKRPRLPREALKKELDAQAPKRVKRRKPKAK